MPLSDEQRAKVRALAEEMGADPAEAERIAEEEAGDPESRAKESPEAKPATASEPPKVFQYHLPFMTVDEVRALIGLPATKTDGSMFTGEWLAKHGGGTAAPSAATDQSSPQEPAAG